jgi:tetratricopeptide (TPR) repeat protein
MRHLVLAAGTTIAVALSSTHADGQGFRRPDCDLSTGHFLVSSALTYLDGAGSQGDPVKKERLMGDALRTLNDALDRGQEDNPAVWYFYGRYYVMQNDPVGADSMFDRAEELAPQCVEDIQFYRQSLWVPTMNMAMDSMRAGAFEGAKSLLRVAYEVWDQDNLTPYYLARIFGNEGELDSAIHYFGDVIALGNEDTSRVENYETAVFNLGLLHGMAGNWDSSVVWYERYRSEVDADDPQGLVGLAEALDKSGQKDRAMVMYDSIMIRAPEMSAINLFRVGEILFLADEYDKSVQAFTLGLEKNPYFRPALYNLANAYLAIANDEERPEAERDEAAAAMEDAARRLNAVDPLNSESMNLLAASFQLQRLDDSTVAVLERREALTFEVRIDLQQTIDGGYLVQGRLVNTKDAAVEVPRLEFEFLDEAGNVLAIDYVEPTTLDPMGSATFSLTGIGEDLAACRYSIEG